MTDDTLDLYSNSRYQSASVGFVDGSTVGLAPDEYDLLSEAFRSLKPIKTSRVGSITGDAYSLCWFAGMDPACIKLKELDDGLLTFSFDEFVYTGGSVTAFRRAMDKVMELGTDRIQPAEK